MIVQLYKRYIRIRQISYEGSTAVVEHKDKDQAAVLEITESFILCRHQAYKTHIKRIAIFINNDDRLRLQEDGLPTKGAILT